MNALLNKSAFCAPGGTRTPNLLIRSQTLYPLSYGCNKVIIPERRNASITKFYEFTKRLRQVDAIVLFGGFFILR